MFPIPLLDKVRFFEFAVPQILVKFIGLRIIGHEQIRPSVLVVIEHCHAERLRAAVRYPAGGGNVLERSISAVMK